MLNYSIETITTEPGIEGLEENWNRLSASAEFPNIFMTYDWFRAWNQIHTREQRGGLRRPNVLVFKREGAIAGIAPLIYRETSRCGLTVRKLEFVGREADYNDLVVGDDPAGQSQALVQFLAQGQTEWDVAEFWDLRDAVNTQALTASALGEAGLAHRILPEGYRCPYLPIDGPWSEIVSGFSRAARHTLRKQQRRLERMGAQGLRVRLIENPHAESGLVPKLVAVESQKLVHGEPSPPVLGKYPEVYQTLFDTLGPRGWLLVALMELEERPLAWQIWFRCGKKIWGFLTAYDHAFSHLSPGTMLIPAVLDYGFAHGFEECDFLRGDEAYKMRWTTRFHQTHRLLIWRRRWGSRARAFVYLDLKEAVYRLMGKGE